jgi:hypothetical protein
MKRASLGEGQGLEGVRGLVVDSYAVLVVFASYFLPVLSVENHNPIPVLQIGHGTLLAIGFPNDGRHDLAVLEVSFLFLGIENHVGVTIDNCDNCTIWGRTS